MGEIKVNIINGLGEGPCEEVIKFTEKNLDVHFPKSFLHCIRQSDEGRPENHLFSFKNHAGEKERSCVGAFLSFEPSNKYNILRNYLLYFYHSYPYFVPFAEVGNGDFIGFDYSIEGFGDLDPPIIYFDHEQIGGQNFSDIAINFEEFLKKLEPEEN